MAELSTVAPAFVEMAHRIVWCTMATADGKGRPRTRIVHPIWEWDGGALTGWVATSPRSPKARHLDAMPAASITYWHPDHDVATADCDTVWESTAAERQAGWERFANGPAPVGYDPSIIPQWPNPEAPEFGILRLEPRALRVMPGKLMLEGKGDLLTWRG